jgi:hypothetical protein
MSRALAFLTPPWSARLGVLVSLIAGAGCAPPVVDAPKKATSRPADAAAASPGGGTDAGRGQDVTFTIPDAPPPSDALVGTGTACPGPAVTQPPSCASLGVTVDPYYAGLYTCFDLGPVPGVPPQKYGGLTLTTGPCSSTLLIGGEANYPRGKLYAATVTRDGMGHITGFTGPAKVFEDAAYNDGGVTYGPGGVLFLTLWPENKLQQIKPGSTGVDKLLDLAALEVAQSSAALAFVPPGLPGAGALKLISWGGGQWYTLDYRPDAAGTYDIASVKEGNTLPGGPEGFVYVAAGSQKFPVHSMLVSEWTANTIATYEVDEHGDPKLESRRDFITGLMGAEGAYRDPATGDFFFSTWGQALDRVIVVRGFERIVE